MAFGSKRSNTYFIPYTEAPPSAASKSGGKRGIMSYKDMKKEKKNRFFTALEFLTHEQKLGSQLKTPESDKN
jgi:hypothetical protein